MSDILNKPKFVKNEIVWYAHFGIRTAILQVTESFKPYYKHNDGFGENYVTYTYNTLANFSKPNVSRVGLYSYVTEVDLEKFDIAQLLDLYAQVRTTINNINNMYGTNV